MWAYLIPTHLEVRFVSGCLINGLTLYRYKVPLGPWEIAIRIVDPFPDLVE